MHWRHITDSKANDTEMSIATTWSPVPFHRYYLYFFSDGPTRNFNDGQRRSQPLTNNKLEQRQGDGVLETECRDEASDFGGGGGGEATSRCGWIDCSLVRIVRMTRRQFVLCK